MKGVCFMKFAGVQKLTLLDFPGVVACTAFTVGCNFKCPFCHNATLVNGKDGSFLSEDEVVDFLKSRVGILEGVVVTGGEPLLHHDIDGFLRKVKELGYSVKIDTNGTNPELLEKLVNEKLVDYVAMDIKNSPGEYEPAVGKVKADLSAIGRSKDFLLRGKTNYEFRTTVVKGIHTKESIASLTEWISGAKRYFLQQYKESSDILCPQGLTAFSKEEMQQLLDIAKPNVHTADLRGI